MLSITRASIGNNFYVLYVYDDIYEDIVSDKKSAKGWIELEIDETARYITNINLYGHPYHPDSPVFLISSGRTRACRISCGIINVWGKFIASLHVNLPINLRGSLPRHATARRSAILKLELEENKWMYKTVWDLLSFLVIYDD